MDTSDPDIRFDARGICNHCHSYDQRAKREVLQQHIAEDLLSKLVAEIRARAAGAKYHCVIGLSGGVDSAMVALVVKRLGLNPLAVHFDNGWNSAVAVRNIKNCLSALDIDLFTHVAEWQEFRDLQLSMLRASIVNTELVTDHAIMALLFRTAASHGIKYVISGGNVKSEAVMPRAWTYDSRDARLIAAVHQRFGQVFPVKSYPFCRLSDYARHIVLDRIKYVPILNYVEYNKNTAKQMLQSTIGWSDYGGKHHESIFTRFYQCYILPKKFNIDKRRAHFSALVLSGQMTRDAALLELTTPPLSAEIVAEDLSFFLNKMELTHEEFANIMTLPMRDPKDYKSNAWLFARYDSHFFDLVKRAVRPSSLASTRKIQRVSQ